VSNIEFQLQSVIDIHATNKIFMV